MGLSNVLDVNKTVPEWIDSIKKSFEVEDRKKYEPYIRYLRFPHYKIMAEDSRIDFDFPLTVIVGANGTNKTSILQALYGCPSRKSIGTYWFSTKVDKIIDDDSWRHRIIYGYKHEGANKVVEAIKTRVNAKNNPDYWEPSRPLKELNMEPVSEAELQSSNNKNKTRWDLIEKEVVFSDCKAYLSAYDLFFYHTNFDSTKTMRTKQDFIRRRAIKLSEVIENKQDELYYNKVQQVSRFEKVSDEVCDVASWIMNKSYEEICVVSHTLYAKRAKDQAAKTIWIHEKNMEYSEAFAGSGESRVILLINDILNAPEKTLILIDEPEISLHPQATENLKKFILSQVLKKKQQIVISTHSPDLVRELPKEAIKLLILNGNKVNVAQNVTYQEAFSGLGHKLDTKKKIFVEDELSLYMVEEMIRIQYKDILGKSVSVQILPGGVDTIICNNIPNSALAATEEHYYILDGDRNAFPYKVKRNGTPVDIDINEDWVEREEEKIKESCIASTDNVNLEKIIRVLCCENNIKIPVDGNSGKSKQEQKYSLQRKFIKYWEDNVFFLPSSNPEQAIIKEMEETNYALNSNGKEYFEKMARKEVTNPESHDILFVQRRSFNGLKIDGELKLKISNILKKILG